MKNMKIRAKLILGFSIVVMLTSVGGISGVIGVKSMETANTRLYNHETKPIISIFGALENIDRIRIQTGDLVINAENNDKVKALEVSVNEIMANFERRIAEYGATVIKQTEEQEIYENIKEQYTTRFKPGVQEIIQSAKNGTGQNELIDMMAGLTTSTELIATNINKCIELREIIAESSAVSNSYFARRIIYTIYVVIVVSVIVALILAYALSGMIGNPLIRMTAFLNKVQKSGDMTFTKAEQEALPKDMKLKDEIGICVNACAGLVKRIMEVNEKLTKLAEGDLTSQMEMLSEKDSIGLAFNNMIRNLNTMLGEIQSASDQISSGAQQISQGAQELASGSARQADSVEKFSVSLAGIDRKIQINAGKAEDARETSNQAGAMLELSIRSMSEMLTAMREIDESSQSITKVIKVIDDIAFQTNILALNAAVEAARAGQHGKGFAVVAEEVRNLAAKSAEAARETAELIEGSSAKVKEGNQIVEKTNASLEAVVTGAKEASILLGEVAADSAEQAKTIQEINRGIEHISGVIQENSSSAEESASASQEMAEQAAMLNDIVIRFRLN